MLVAAAVFGVTASAAGAAANHSTRFAARYVGQPASALITKTSQSNYLPTGLVPSLGFVACQGAMPDILTGASCALTPPKDDGGLLGAPAFVPQATKSLHIAPAGPTLGANFLGLTDVTNYNVNGYHDTPPDQGLCVGPAGPFEGLGLFSGVPVDQSVVVEMANDLFTVYDTSGNVLFTGSGVQLFNDVNSTGDPECTYDKATGAFFFTEIGVQNGAYYTTNLAVIDSVGYASYNVDTSGGGGYCFPDFPHQGSDTNAFYITVNEFCGADESFAGGNIYALSKSQLAAEGNVNAVAFSTGIFYGPWRPADGASSTEYLLSSDQNAASASDLQVAWVSGDQNITTGIGPVTLSITSIASQPYAEPVPATSTGNDGGANNTTDCVHQFTNANGTWCSVKEATIDGGDDRLEQVTLSHGMLYTSLTTSMTFPGDPTAYDGAAWFVVDPAKLKVVKQGYMGSAGTNIIYPSFIQSKWDKKGKASHYFLSFSMTSPTLNPSTAYVSSTNSGKWFGFIQTTGSGSGPHVSYSTFYPGYDRRRWGDYSRIAVDPSNGSIWSADEFVPPGPDGADVVDNWGTQVWQVSK